MICLKKVSTQPLSLPDRSPNVNESESGRMGLTARVLPHHRMYVSAYPAISPTVVAQRIIQ
jgi:hypothetical protein